MKRVFEFEQSMTVDEEHEEITESNQNLSSSILVEFVKKRRKEKKNVLIRLSRRREDEKVQLLN